jgi:hypothetical protein
MLVRPLLVTRGVLDHFHVLLILSCCELGELGIGSLGCLGLLPLFISSIHDGNGGMYLLHLEILESQILGLQVRLRSWKMEFGQHLLIGSLVGHLLYFLSPVMR